MTVQTAAAACRVRASPHRAQDTTTTTAFAQTADESLTSSPSTLGPGARECGALFAAQAKAREMVRRFVYLPRTSGGAGGRPSGASSDPRQPCAVRPLPARYHEVSRPCGAAFAPSPSDRSSPGLSAPPTRTANPTPVSLLPLRQIPDAA